MFELLQFFVVKHDARLVVLAAFVCLLSAYACMSLVRHARRTHGRDRLIWIGVAAVSVGFGIWSTHFIAMVAFHPGFAVLYDVPMTVLSLLLAISICGTGLFIAVEAQSRRTLLLGGAVVGAGISVMHYTGIAAMVLGGMIMWQPAMIAISIAIGAALAAFATVVGVEGGWKRLGAAALTLTLAICIMHFTGVAASNFENCFAVVNDNGELSPALLSGALFIASLLILSAVFGSILLDRADRLRTARELARSKADEQRILEANGRLRLALAHMNQALLLFDREGRLALYNSQFPILFKLDPAQDYKGMTLLALCRAAVRSSATTTSGDLEQRVAEIHAAHHKLATSADGGELVHPFGADRTIRIIHSPIEDGSWVTMIEDITERQRSEARIAYLARYDSLTGLPNRAQFLDILDDTLAEATYDGSKLAVIGIDLDRFKEVNDTYGHGAGDHVLKAVAAQMSSAIGPGEAVARLGGDEFAAMKRFKAMEELESFVSRLEAALTARVEHGEFTVTSGASIGIAVCPQDGTDRERLLNNADLAMYRAKASFDHRVAYYEAEMDEFARKRRETARDLWTALEQGQFFLNYQVQKSVESGRITGYEVLLRWMHPVHGLISPADFIPIAEECGAIRQIGAWVLETACKEAAEWELNHKIAVNLSALQLTDIGLIETVRNCLVHSGLPPHRLELEVTESAIIADKVRALHILRQIRAMGVTIAIDDFGVGYSSLETLRSFPFDKIKLDRSFMAELESSPQAKAIIRAILALGASLDVPVLAEGVETPEQLAVLQREGCREAQGFLLGRPQRVADLDLLWPQPVAV